MDQQDAGNNNENDSPSSPVENDAVKERDDVQNEYKSHKEELLVRFEYILDDEDLEHRYVRELERIQFHLGVMENDELLEYCGERILRSYIQDVKDVMTKDLISDCCRLTTRANDMNVDERESPFVPCRHEEIERRCVRRQMLANPSRNEPETPPESHLERGQQRRQPPTLAAGSDSNTEGHGVGERENGEGNERPSNVAAAGQGPSSPAERSNGEIAGHQQRPVQIPLNPVFQHQPMAATQAPPTFTHRNHPLYGQKQRAAANAFPFPFYTREAFEDRSFAESAAGMHFMALASALNMAAPTPALSLRQQNNEPRIHDESLARPHRQPHPNQFERPREATSTHNRNARSRSRQLNRREPETSRSYNWPNSNSSRRTSTTNYVAAAAGSERQSALHHAPGSSSSRSSSTRNREESSRRRSREEKKKAKEDQRSTAHAIVQLVTASQKLAGRGRSMTCSSLRSLPTAREKKLNSIHN